MAAMVSDRTQKTRLLSLADLDNRTKAAQIAQETKAAIIADLGGEDRLSTLEVLQAEHAAMSAAVLRDHHVRWLKGEQVDVAAMVSVQNVFNRTAAALGTTRRPKDVVDINSYLRGEAPSG